MNTMKSIFRDAFQILILMPLLVAPEISNYNINSHFPAYYNSLTKVSFTQKGYIQFLRYIVDVPIITEFTFCLWLKSDNLTYAHPLLSYSKHEEERYIRAWLSPHGEEINMALLENEVFKIPLQLRVHHWYHICASWDSNTGLWELYLNAKLKNSGYQPQLVGVGLPEGGDIVVGQEYTDFDKGLDDGVEGDIFGFNLVLESTASRGEVTNNLLSSPDWGDRRIFMPSDNRRLGNVPNKLSRAQTHQAHPKLFGGQPEASEIPHVLGYFAGMNRSPKGLEDDILGEIMGWFQPQRKVRIVTNRFALDPSNGLLYLPNSLTLPRDRANKRIIGGHSRIASDFGGISRKSLGLQLIELSHNCALGRGAPLSHKKVIVNWTTTPVRVFGGAILKNIAPFCKI